MAKRMSNRERIEKAALESAAADAEKKAGETSRAREKPDKKAKKSTPAGARRQKIVWKVLDSTFKEVAQFPFPQKGDAEADAAKRTEKSGRDHFVSRAEVPMGDAE